MTRRFAVVSIPALILLIVMATGTVLIASPTPGSTEAIVTIDETGAMRINGELFFPIGLYQVPYWEMADVRAHGFNIVDESKEPLKLALGYKAEVFYKTSHALRHVRNSNGIGNSAGSA